MNDPERETTPLPPVTHLQFVVLGALRQGERPGRALRQALDRHGARKSTPAFYQLMARLEDSGLVEGRYARKSIDGQVVKERHYRLTGAGTSAWRATCRFYREQLPTPDALQRA